MENSKIARLARWGAAAALGAAGVYWASPESSAMTNGLIALFGLLLVQGQGFLIARADRK